MNTHHALEDEQCWAMGFGETKCSQWACWISYRYYGFEISQKAFEFVVTRTFNRWICKCEWSLTKVNKCNNNAKKFPRTREALGGKFDDYCGESDSSDVRRKSRKKGEKNLRTHSSLSNAQVVTFVAITWKSCLNEKKRIHVMMFGKWPSDGRSISWFTESIQTSNGRKKLFMLDHAVPSCCISAFFRVSSWM